MVALPTAKAVASPRGVLMLTVATLASDEVQLADAVMSCIEPSVKVPVAVNCCVRPTGIEGIAGVIAIDTNVAGVTVKLVEPVIEPEVAMTLAVPRALLLARPAAPIVAIEVSEEVQLTELVRSCVLPSV